MNRAAMLAASVLLSSAVIAADAPPGKFLAQPTRCVTPFANCRTQMVTNDLLPRGCLYSDPGGQLRIEPGYRADAEGRCVRETSEADPKAIDSESHVDWDGKN